MRHPGGIAQLGERLNGIQEVSGSIPLISTKEKFQDIQSWSFFILGYFIDIIIGYGKMILFN